VDPNNPLPVPVQDLIEWGWNKTVSALWLTAAPVRGHPQYRIEWTDDRKIERSVITDDPANYEVGPLIRLLDQAYQATKHEITHLVWLPARQRACIWYTQNGGQKYATIPRG
jgi:hypothetical protein